MGSIAGLFVPDDLRQLPALDPDNPDFRADAAWMARIKSRGGAMAGAGASEHRHEQ